MNGKARASGDSPAMTAAAGAPAAPFPGILPEAGGAIPGHPDRAPAFTLRFGEPTTIPVVVAVPHAGRHYPPALLAQMRDPGQAMLRLEDRLADLLGTALHERTGAALLVAQAPRAMIDLNRAPDDVDWSMVAPAPARHPAEAAQRGGAARRARSGLGLVPRRVPGLGELWRDPLAADDLAERIARVHLPYHRTLTQVLDRVRARWGAALLIDLHSMPPLPVCHPGEPGAHFVIGDRFGSSCDGALVAGAFTVFAAARRRAAHNRPYAGGYALERHAACRQGIHGLQVEVDRTVYLDAAMEAPGPGFAATVDFLATLVQRLAADIADIGRSQSRWLAAAE